MKNLNLLFIFLIISTVAFAQNVGIGTTTPAQKLHVSGNIQLDSRSLFFGPSQRIYGDARSAFYFDGEHPSITQLILRDSNNVIHGRLYGGGSGRYFGLLDGDGQWSYIADKDVYTGFRINNSEKMRILANGNVGVGTTNPVQKMHVNGNVQLDGRSLFFGPQQRVYGDTRSAWYFDGNHPTTTQLVMRDSNRVVHGRVYGAGSGRYFGLLDGDGNWSYLQDKDVYTSLRIDNSEKMRINANGHVGIGTSSPAGKLTIKVDSAARGLEVHSTFGNTHIPWTNGWSYISGHGVIFRTDGNKERMRVATNGNVGIGTTNPTTKLAVNGNVRSKEVLVETANWPDYVFDESYELPTLNQEANFIKENGHLSGFESEEAMDGTITVGDVTKRQQEKIEQMMLHLIDMKNGMDAMQQGMKKMESEISELKEENQELKDKLDKK